jgi:hypothetical protein
MSNDEPLFNWFEETDGFVDRPASRERAVRESKNGVKNQRHKKITKYLDLCGVQGGTWRELGEILGLHHGQISGALSKMHSNGEIFSLRQQRDKCHPYVHLKYQSHYSVEERFDEPAKTMGVLRAEENERLKEELENMRIERDIWKALAEKQQEVLEKLRNAGN